MKTQQHRNEQACRLYLWAQRLHRVDEMFEYLMSCDISERRFYGMMRGKNIGMYDDANISTVAGWIGAPQSGLGTIEKP